jgi:hypothetical protein
LIKKKEKGQEEVNISLSKKKERPIIVVWQRQEAALHGGVKLIQKFRENFVARLSIKFCGYHQQQEPSHHHSPFLQSLHTITHIASDCSTLVQFAFLYLLSPYF